ncbi:MAG: hydrolase [Rhodocyclales bacterium GWA2_65_20]|nr:MAG: hydrolase [Rhodocyclales bacterium GWA2_65_20]
MSTWIFLRGLTRESRHWGDFPAAFRGEIPAADIVALDLPGNGRLHRMRSPTSVAAMAEYCRAELLAQGIRPPYRLLAMSLGAMVAVAWATKHPEEIAGCVLINTSLRPFSPFYSRLRPGNYAALLGLALPGGNADATERTILRLTSKLAGQRTQIVAAWSAWRREHPVSHANALRQLLAASRYRAPARKPAVPMLILAGAADTLVDPRCSQQLARLWQTDFAEHPGAGHDIPLDDGAWVVRQVRDWLLRA